VNNELVSAKAHKDYRTKIGDKVSISVPKEICHLFDIKTGARIGD
jgi:multiple sugar transport system ATP-binding protein